MLGIDLSRHNPVTSWSAIKAANVGFAYVKGTDGGGPAPVMRADQYVAGAKSVGIPVGLYHYAQLSPSPEAQADVLTGEVRRLGATGMPPALDLEDPWKPGQAAAQFASRFLARLRQHGFPLVTLYANTSMLNGINAQALDDDPQVLIWAANYGRNDGNRHQLTYRGRVDIHQYTSAGTVAGVTGRVDLNESLTDILGDNDMATPRETWEDYGVQVLAADGTPVPDYRVSAQEMLARSNQAVWITVNQTATVLAKLDALAGTLTSNQAALLAAIGDEPTQVDLTTEQLQLLLAGLSGAAKQGLRELLAEISDGGTQ